MIPDSRDRSAIANQLFNHTVPPELMNYLEPRRDTLIPEFRAVWAAAKFKTRGTWEEVFGPGAGTDEFSWPGTLRVTRVAWPNLARPNIRCRCLSMLRSFAGYQPGQYPSAGPLPHLMDIWRAGAPQIDFLSPDIYFPNFAEWCRKYHQAGNPLSFLKLSPAPQARSMRFTPSASTTRLDSAHSVLSRSQSQRSAGSPEAMIFWRSSRH